MYELDESQVTRVKYMLERQELRDIYDRSEIFIGDKKSELKVKPSEGSQYMQSFSKIGEYAMFVLLLKFSVEEHQQFAKQAVITSMLIFAFMSVQLKMPRESSGEETVIVEWVKKFDFLNGMTYFELNHIITRLVYPGIYHMVMHVSRMVDQAPEVAMKLKLLRTQRQLTRTLMPLEMICERRNKDE